MEREEEARIGRVKEKKSNFSQCYSFCTFLDKMHNIATAVRKAAERENNMRHGKNMFLI